MRGVLRENARQVLPAPTRNTCGHFRRPHPTPVGASGAQNEQALSMPRALAGCTEQPSTGRLGQCGDSLLIPPASFAERPQAPGTEAGNALQGPAR